MKSCVNNKYIFLGYVLDIYNIQNGLVKIYKIQYV